MPPDPYDEIRNRPRRVKRVSVPEPSTYVDPSSGNDIEDESFTILYEDGEVETYRYPRGRPPFEGDVRSLVGKTRDEVQKLPLGRLDTNIAASAFDKEERAATRKDDDTETASRISVARQETTQANQNPTVHFVRLDDGPEGPGQYVVTWGTDKDGNKTLIAKKVGDVDPQAGTTAESRYRDLASAQLALTQAGAIPADVRRAEAQTRALEGKLEPEIAQILASTNLTGAQAEELKIKLREMLTQGWGGLQGFGDLLKGLVANRTITLDQMEQIWGSRLDDLTGMTDRRKAEFDRAGAMAPTIRGQDIGMQQRAMELESERRGKYATGVEGIFKDMGGLAKEAGFTPAPGSQFSREDLSAGDYLTQRLAFLDSILGKAVTPPEPRNTPTEQWTNNFMRNAPTSLTSPQRYGPPGAAPGAPTTSLTGPGEPPVTSDDVVNGGVMYDDEMSYSEQEGQEIIGSEDPMATWRDIYNRKTMGMGAIG